MREEWNWKYERDMELTIAAAQTKLHGSYL